MNTSQQQATADAIQEYESSIVQAQHNLQFNLQEIKKDSMKNFEKEWDKQDNGVLIALEKQMNKIKLG